MTLKMKAKKDEFAKFCKYFRDYQHQFGLNEYKVGFKFEPIDGSFADITIDQAEMVAIVRLNSDLPDGDVRKSAKHEALHLLVSRLERRARERYTNAAEIYEATEELVRRIDSLLKEVE